ncbi:hypothetical protein RYX36_009881 [Vicia faba]
MFVGDVKGFDLVDVYLKHSVGNLEVIDESELLHDYDGDIDVEVVSECDDTDVEVVSEHDYFEVQDGIEHADTEFQRGYEHDDSDVQSGGDINKNSGDEDDDDYVETDVS